MNKMIDIVYWIVFKVVAPAIPFFLCLLLDLTSVFENDEIYSRPDLLVIGMAISSCILETSLRRGDTFGKINIVIAFLTYTSFAILYSMIYVQPFGYALPWKNQSAFYTVIGALCAVDIIIGIVGDIFIHDASDQNP